MDKNFFPAIFQSVEYVKKYLLKKYEEENISSSKEVAYKNCYPFVYYIKLGETYFREGISSPLSIKPVLLFYGLTHWLKASILIKDPHYPATTQVLAHGVSTRKKKKKNYRFLHDEVKVQKDGFFPYFSETVFQTKLITGDKYKMDHLLKSIPDLMGVIKQLQGEKALIVAKKVRDNFVVSKKLLETVQLTEKQFERKIKEKIGVSIECISKDENVELQIEKETGSFPIYESLDGKLYIPTQLHLYWNLPELLIHYMLLYNLSMICRYETEWWGELLYSFSVDDRIYIDAFLQCTEKKILLLIKKLFFLD